MHNHEILLKSIKSEIEVFSNEIAQINGTISNPCNIQYVEIVLNNDHRDLVQISNKGVYKHLIRLKKESVNKIELIYCDATKHVIIEHKECYPITLDVVPLYIINKNHDGKFQSTSEDQCNDTETALTKINLALELIQCVISSKFVENGLKRKCFNLKKCEVFDSDLDVEEAQKKDQWDLYNLMATEIYKKKGGDICGKTKFVAFISCTKYLGVTKDDYSYANAKLRTLANPSLGGGFICLLGTGCLYSWPKNLMEVIPAFSNKTIVNIEQVLDDSNYRKTYGGCFSTTLGSLLHEICHTWDLAHTATGMMGNDIDFIHRFFLNQNFTDVMPERNVKSCNLVPNKQPNIHPHQRKLTKLKKPGGNFLNKYHQQKDSDMTFFEHNCLMTLYYHKWFNNYNTIHSEITFDNNGRAIKTCCSFIKLVEIRELDTKNSLLIKFWSFIDNDVVKFSIPSEINLEQVTLFAIDDSGNIFKKDFR